MPLPLYQITGRMQQIVDLLADAEVDTDRAGEIDPAIAAVLDDLECDQAVKFDDYLAVIRQFDAYAAAQLAERDRWDARLKASKANAERLRERLKHHLEVTGQTRVTTARGVVVSVVKNGGFAPLVLNEGFTPDDEDVPSDCIRIKREFDRTAIRARLEAGQPLPANFAKIGERGTSLRVK